jgi:hypothetical protein
MTGEEYARALGGGNGKTFTDPPSPLKLFAIACEPGRAYPSTLSVIMPRKTRTWRFSDFERGTLRALRESAVSGGAPRAARFHVRVGRAVRIRAVILARGAKTPLASTTYLVQSRRAAYMISYATVRELNPRYAPLFDDSVRSLREL